MAMSAIARDGTKLPQGVRDDDAPWSRLPTDQRIRLEAAGWCCSMALMEALDEEPWAFCSDISKDGPPM